MRSELRVETDGDRMDLTIENFQRDTLELSGQVRPGAMPLYAEGVFESSGGESGDWELTHLTAPTPGAILAVIVFDHPARSCQSTLEFAGLVEGGRRLPGTLGLNEVVALRWRVAGQGRTRTVTLGRDESRCPVRWASLVGQYDILVQVHHGGPHCRHAPRVGGKVTAEGARVGTVFSDLSGHWRTRAPLMTAGELSAARPCIRGQECGRKRRARVHRRAFRWWTRPS